MPSLLLALGNELGKALWVPAMVGDVEVHINPGGKLHQLIERLFRRSPLGRRGEQLQAHC